MPNRAPTVIWVLRKDTFSGYVETTDDDGIRVTLPADGDPPRMTSVELSRKDARLLAKRLNECLNETVKGQPWSREALR